MFFFQLSTCLLDSVLILWRELLLMVNIHFVLLSMDDSETERDEQRSAPTKKKCLFDDSIVGKVWITESAVFNTSGDNLFW